MFDLWPHNYIAIDITGAKATADAGFRWFRPILNGGGGGGGVLKEKWPKMDRSRTSYSKNDGDSRIHFITLDINRIYNSFV